MKPICIISSPFATRSGYGDMARDIVRHMVDLDQYDVKLISMGWGSCPQNALDPVKDAHLISLIAQPPFQLSRKPELYIQISVPNEFQPQGQYNIGITAGIETTLCSPEWIEGCNRMNVVWTISEHSKRVLESTVVNRHTQDGKQVDQLKLNVPVEVLHNCVHTDIFKKIDSSELDPMIGSELSAVKEDFNFLFVGHWLQGGMGEDRKNVGLLVKTFCETFKNKGLSNRPGLILKTSGAGFSILENADILRKIKVIRDSVGPSCPNVYVLSGDLTEVQMNSLYNHPKVKAHISFTKGEGFGRPLLEATMSQKPLLATGWSGHLDFLNVDDAILLRGELRNVEPGAVWKGVIIPESQWYNVDTNFAAEAMRAVIKQYDGRRVRAQKLATANKVAFSYDAIKQRTAELLNQYVPKFVIPSEINLPKLRKITR